MTAPLTPKDADWARMIRQKDDDPLWYTAAKRALIAYAVGVALWVIIGAVVIWRMM